MTYMDDLYYEVAEVVRSALAKEKSIRTAVYGSAYKALIVSGIMPDHDSPKCNPFGTRYLVDESRVWEHNAWDNVEWSEEQLKDAEGVIEKQMKAKVDEERVQELLDEPVKQWDQFYSQHNNNFFKDRNWLLKEFHELDMDYHEGETPVRVLEVGCGVGNTTFPLIQWDQHRKMFLYTSDYSSVAVEVLKNDEKYDPSRMFAFQWDITQPPPSEAPLAGSLDFVVCIYVLSALHPSKTRQALQYLSSLLKPGGTLLLKDYGRFDLTQLRFKKDRLIEENLYCRGDGTLVYFFSQEELDRQLVDVGLEKIVNIVDRRLIVNRAKQVKMYRQWLQNKKALLRLSCEVPKYKEVFDDILQDSDLKKLVRDPQIDGNVLLLHVLLYEYLLGSGLNRASPKLKAVVMKLGKEIKDKSRLLDEAGRGIRAVKEKEATKKETIEIPRYARINTLKWTHEEAIDALMKEDWKIVELEDPDKFAERVSKLRQDEVLLDPHVANLLVFPQHPEFHTYWMVEQRYLILQDKASCLPAFLLNPKKNAHVFDTCAAPGMKTSHAAAILKGTGKVWAVDRADDRAETMRELLKINGAENTEVFNGDFLKLNVLDKRFSKVKYAIVDPPCSGSGIVKRMDEVTGGNRDQTRLDKLKNLQAMILKHAMKFPNLERVVYSTCSIHEEENEHVVDEVLLDTYVRQNFRLCADILPTWKYRGLDSYPDIGIHCLRADPEKTLTNGFFVAVFERLPQ